MTMNEKKTIEEQVVALLKKYNLILTTAESCTGGLVAGRIVNVSGVSEVFSEGYITYSNEAKKKHLQVSQGTLTQFGAVSEEVALEMVHGAIVSSKATAAIAVTGIAGPEGGTSHKPVGLVYIACAVKDKSSVRQYHFNGDRKRIRELAVESALQQLYELIVTEFERNL